VNSSNAASSSAGLVALRRDARDRACRDVGQVEEFFRGRAARARVLARQDADLPVEQAKTLELVVNAKTGAAIGVVLSSELRLRANRVIE
jgi:hypothetical protein